MERLDKRIAASGCYSRAEAKTLIRAGRVLVDGIAPKSGEDKVSDTARITVDGQALDCRAFRYLMLYKPEGILSATEDRTQSTVLDLLPAPLRRLELFPVGRLDKDTTGLLLLTNDGDLAHRVISPKHHVPKRYLALLEAPITEDDQKRFAEGLQLADGTCCLPAELLPGNEQREARVTVYEGKYHQVKRMFAAVGKPVLRLHREAIGALELDSALKPGEFRELKETELSLIFSGNRGPSTNIRPRLTKNRQKS